MNSYTEKDISLAISKLNLSIGDNLYISGNLANFGMPNIGNLKNLTKIFYYQIKKAIGLNGTIIVPTHSFNETKNLSQSWFINKKSESGSFSNFILQNKNSIRQYHPFASVCAIGKNAKFICNFKNRNAYDKNSPFDKMIKIKTKFLSIGIKYNLNCTQVHFLENINKVPYRYQKTFVKKVRVKKKATYKKFNLYVLKEKYIKVKRDRNKLIFKNFKKKSEIKKVKLSSNYLYCYNLYEFFVHTNRLMKKNKYCWLGRK